MRSSSIRVSVFILFRSYSSVIPVIHVYLTWKQVETLYNRAKSYFTLWRYIRYGYSIVPGVIFIRIIWKWKDSRSGCVMYELSSWTIRCGVICWGMQEVEKYIFLYSLTIYIYIYIYIYILRMQKYRKAVTLRQEQLQIRWTTSLWNAEGNLHVYEPGRTLCIHILWSQFMNRIQRNLKQTRAIAYVLCPSAQRER